MHNSNIVQKAVDLADLLSLSTEIGASTQIRSINEVYLVGPDDTDPRMIGNSIAEAAAMLRAMAGSAGIAQLDGVSS